MLIVAGVQTQTGTMLLMRGPTADFASDTGVSWATFRGDYPTVATQFEMTSQSSVAGAAFVGVLAVMIAVFGLRRRQRWAWFALWSVPAFMVPGIIGLLAADNQRIFGYFGLGLATVAVLGLVLSIPAVFGHGEQRRRMPLSTNSGDG